MSRRTTLLLAVLGIGCVTALASGCKNPPTKEETAAVEYGPRPETFEQIIREYLKPKLTDPAAIVEFKAGPTRLYQQDTALRPLQYGWAVCTMIKDKGTYGAVEGFYPMVFFIRDGKIIAVNGGSDDNLVGWRFARTGCRELGYEIP